tara:strand:- start:11761 stop:11925 length:165 start_codon:yes stop_codon:yes gene_type:complete
MDKDKNVYAEILANELKALLLGIKDMPVGWRNQSDFDTAIDMSLKHLNILKDSL